MPKYRKKPIIVEAHQWFKNGDHPKDNSDPGHEGQVVRYFRAPDINGQDRCLYCSIVYYCHGWIDTVQGGHIVCPEDWIITDDRRLDSVDT